MASLRWPRCWPHRKKNRRASTGQRMALVLRRPIGERERDLFWAQTCPEVFDALVNRSGWGAEQYAEWVESLIENLSGNPCGRTWTDLPTRG